MHQPAGHPARRRERVLPTLNDDGTRRWIRPRLFARALLGARRGVARDADGAVRRAAAHLASAGKPRVLLDLCAREFTLFGATFLPTDSVLLMLLLLGDLR